MIKTTLHTLTKITFAAFPLYASEYVTGCQHTQPELTANPINVPAELMPFVANNSAGHRLKFRMTLEEYKKHYSLFQMYPYFSVIIDDTLGSPQSEIPCPNSSSTTQPRNP